MDSRRQELKDRITRLRGYFGPFHQAVLQLDPDWLERYLAFVCAPIEAGRISMRLTQLIYVAIDSAPSHLYPSGIRTHCELALRHGATPQELVETLEIGVSLTAMTAETGFPILMEELAAAGDPPAESGQAREALAKKFRNWTGEVPDWVEGAARLAPECVSATVDLIAHPWEHGALPARDRALIALACSASPAVLNEAGIRRHIREALRHGATAQELAEVLCLSSGIGIHGMSVGGVVLAEVLTADAATGS